MNDIKKIIRDLTKKESLRMIKESQASFLKESSSNVEDVIKDVDDGIIDVNEKRLEKLKREEESAKEKEDFSELKRIKEEQFSAVNKMIAGYSRKVELLSKMKTELQQEILDITSSGAGIFKNQEIGEFKNEGFEKDWGLRIETPNTSTDLIKILDNANAYKVINTNIPNLKANDLLKLPDLKIGGGGNVNVYRKVGERQENVANFRIENITKMVKNPK